MTKLGELRVDFVGESTSLEVAGAKSKAIVASVGKQVGELSKVESKASSETLKFGDKLGGLGKRVGLVKGGLRNLTFQAQDFVVQAQMGTRTSTILAQQLPQLGASFGQVGLVIFSVLGGLAALGGLMLSTGGDAETLEEQIDELGKSMEKYKKSSDVASLSTEELIEKFGSASTAIRAVLADLAQIDGNATASQIETMITSLTAFAEVEDRINASLLAQKLGLTSFFKPFISLSKQSKSAVIELSQAYADFANAKDNAEKLAAATQLRDKFSELAKEAGGITDEEEAQIVAMSEVILKLQGATVAATGFKTELEQASEFMGLIGQDAEKANTELNKFAAMQASVGLGTGAGPGRGGDPRPLQSRARGRGLDDVPDPKARKQSPLERDLESLRKNLATEIELELEQFARQQEVLRDALEAGLITRQDFEEKTERSKKQHLDRMENLDKMSRTNQINMAQGIFGDLAGLMDSNSKKLFKIGKLSAIAESLISTYKGVAKALELPFPYNLAAAAVVSATGLANVAKIRSTSFGGGGSATSGGAGGGGVAAAGGAQAQQSSFFNVNLQGEGNIGQGSVRDLIGEINNAIDDGAVLRGITVN